MNGYYQPEQPVDQESGQQPTAAFYHLSNLPPEAQPLLPGRPGGWLDPEAENAVPGLKAAPRVRRRLPPNSDHIKHRRTRSGCYTCRSRRIKCDEQRSVCERCRKGQRECVYPEPLSSTKSAPTAKLNAGQKPEQDSGSSSEDEEDEETEGSQSGPASATSPGAAKPRQPSSNTRLASLKNSQEKTNRLSPVDTLSVETKENSISPSTDESSIFSQPRSISSPYSQSGRQSVSTEPSHESATYVHLSKEIRYYLDYHQRCLNHHHYFFKNDASEFVHTILIENALQYEPLLYAVVGFAAFHLTLKKSNGKIQDFLQYYTKSISLLLKSLSSHHKHTEATLLTILQLAAFEEYLGDWVNIIGHQKAAYEMILEFYTPQTIMQTETRRKILAWYSRFDVYVGLLSGYETTLPHEWFSAETNYLTWRARQYPDKLIYEFDRKTAANRLMAMDMALLFAKVKKGAISMEEFVKENQALRYRLDTWLDDMSTLISNQDYMVMSFEGSQPANPDDIVDPHKPGGLYQGPLWDLNFVILDWHALSIMHEFQTAMLLQQQPPPHLAQRALEGCRILETIEYWSKSPPGATLVAQAMVGVASIFLPKDERHIMWSRRKLAKIESMGYIYPATFRARIADLWGIPECHHWWLPNDEGYPPIVRSIRSFIQERAQKPRNQTTEDVRNMKSLFSQMNLLDESPRESPKNSPESSSSVEGGIPVAYSQTTIDSSSSMSSYGIQRPSIEAGIDNLILKSESPWEMNEHLFPHPPTYMYPPPS